MSTVTRANRNLWSVGHGFLSSHSRAIVPKDRLVFYAPLWHPELSGSPFISKDTNALSCTVTGATWGIQGRTFAGGDDVITTPDNANFTVNTLSAFAWVKGDAQNGKPILTKYNGGTPADRSWQFFASNQGSFNKHHVFISSDGTNVDKNYYGSKVIYGDGAFHLVGFTFNAGTLLLYSDGTEDTGVTKTTDTAITSIYNSAINLALGLNYSDGNPNNYFTGTIGEALIYSRVLGAAEAQNLYLATKWRY